MTHDTSQPDGPPKPPPPSPVLPQLASTDAQMFAQVIAYFSGLMKEYGAHQAAENTAGLEQTKLDHTAEHKTRVLGAQLFALVFVSLMVIVAIALFKDKDSLATKLVETVVTALVSAAGGYGYGRKKSKEDD